MAAESQIHEHRMCDPSYLATQFALAAYRARSQEAVPAGEATLGQLDVAAALPYVAVVVAETSCGAAGPVET